LQYSESNWLDYRPCLSLNLDTLHNKFGGSGSDKEVGGRSYGSIHS